MIISLLFTDLCVHIIPLPNLMIHLAVYYSVLISLQGVWSTWPMLGYDCTHVCKPPTNIVYICTYTYKLKESMYIRHTHIDFVMADFQKNYAVRACDLKFFCIFCDVIY